MVKKRRFRPRVKSAAHSEGGQTHGLLPIALRSIRLTHHPVVAEIGKKLFYVRDSVGRVFHDEFYPFLIRESAGVDNISSSLLIGIMPSDLDCRDFNLPFSSFC